MLKMAVTDLMRHDQTLHQHIVDTDEQKQARKMAMNSSYHVVDLVQKDGVNGQRICERKNTRVH